MTNIEPRPLSDQGRFDLESYIAAGAPDTLEGHIIKALYAALLHVEGELTAAQERLGLAAIYWKQRAEAAERRLAEIEGAVHPCEGCRHGFDQHESGADTPFTTECYYCDCKEYRRPPRTAAVAAE